jgi:predicted dehydrogenase
MAPDPIRPSLDRRQFIAAAAAASTGIALGTRAHGASAAPAKPGRKRYALVGTGSRSGMYRDAVLGAFASQAELVGLCDINPGRLELARQRAKAQGADVPAFAAADFDRMIRETKPDALIVTTKDSAHDAHIIRAMQLGCDVITEKPMTIDAARCGAILKAQRETGRRCVVGFNYRYSPPRTQVKELLMRGTIGEVLSVDFHWLLDTRHGADYFRRWHSMKGESGGLMVHKATHHFDLVNWWLSAVPESVTGAGRREFYTPQTARRMGLEKPGPRCRTCEEKARCTFYLDMERVPSMKALYVDHEHHDGYFRDRCIWRPEIDIEDTMSVAVRYDTGATLNYSLNAYCAWEGYTVAFNGTQGRIEHKMEERVYVNGDGTLPGAIKRDGTTIRVYPLRAPAYAVDVWKGEGGHGGGDDLMLRDLFDAQPAPDPYLRAADQRAGAYSILSGIAANQAFATGGTVRIADLVPGLERPDFTPMPSRESPIPMPPRIA